MPAWKNITLSIPDKNLETVSDLLSSIKRILSITIIDRLPENKSQWFDQPDKKPSLTGKTHLIQLLVSAPTKSTELLKIYPPCLVMLLLMLTLRKYLKIETG